MVDLRSNEDDRPYRGVNRAQYTAPGQREEYDYDDTMTTQAYYRERLRGVTEQRWFPLAAVTLGVIIFGSLIAFAYRQGAETSANGTTPLIQAENGTYKEKPQNPGGMDVPFQDAVVFDQIDKSKVADAGNGQVENLLPPPEQPVDAKPAATPAKSTEATPPSAPQTQTDKGVVASNVDEADSVADKIAATEANLKNKTTTPDTSHAEAQNNVATEKATDAVTAATTTAETTKPAATETTTAAKTTAATTVAKTPPKTPPTPKTTTASAPTKATTMDDVVKTTTASATPSKLNTVAPSAATTPTPVKTGTGPAKVQLGAFKDEAAAKAAWASLQKQYAPHLNGVTPNYARADLGAKGVFYRVQGVNLSKAQATDICKAINASKPGACIIPQ